MPRTDPRFASAAKAMVAATALAALLLTAGMGILPIFPAAFAAAFAIALFVTMPIGMLLYGAAWATRSAGWIAAGLGGLLTSAVLWLPDLLRPPSFDEQWFDGVATITGGQYTQLGWFEHLMPAGSTAATGLIAGLFFWFRFMRHSLSSGARRLTYAMVGLAVIAATAYPFATRDRSCHSDYWNPSVAQLGLDIPPGQWPALADELNDFARGGGGSARYSLSRDPGYPWFDFSLCKPNGTRLFVLASPDDGPFRHPVSISLSPLRDGAEWKPMMRALHDRLKARWPDAIRYQNAQGDSISGPPDWLATPAPRSIR